VNTTDVEDLLVRYLQGPEVIRAALQGWEGSSTVPSAGGWSAHDILIHLADAEVVRAVRFRLLLGEERPALFAFDENLWQERLGYDHRSAELALATYEVMVRSSHELLRAVPPESLHRAAPHPTDPPLTCLGLLQRGINHAAEHAAQVTAARAMQQ
jgi:hypothetical protein